MNVAKAVVAGMAAPKFELGFTRHHIKFVMGHQYFLRRNFKKLGQGAHRLARQVHECLRFKQPNGLAFDLRARHLGEIAFIGHQVHIQITRQGVDPPKASVVAGVFVFGAWIAKANKQFDHV